MRRFVALDAVHWPVHLAAQRVVSVSAHTAGGSYSNLDAIARNDQGVSIIGNLDKLAGLISREHDGLLLQWRRQVKLLSSAQYPDAPTLNDHIPRLIAELAAALQAGSDETIPQAPGAASPPAHGLQRLHEKFDIEEVVAEYSILRGCIHDLADANALNLQGKPLRILNRVLDGAIGLAVQTFATQRALEVRRRREEYLAFVAHDLRAPLSAILLAAGVLERALPVQSAEAQQASMFKTLLRNVQDLDPLVGKVIEENTSLPSEFGIKLERRAFDLWPLVEAHEGNVSVESTQGNGSTFRFTLPPRRSAAVPEISAQSRASDAARKEPGRGEYNGPGAEIYAARHTTNHY